MYKTYGNDPKIIRITVRKTWAPSRSPVFNTLVGEWIGADDNEKIEEALKTGHQIEITVER
jgi:hypothetical protein